MVTSNCSYPYKGLLPNVSLGTVLVTFSYRTQRTELLLRGIIANLHEKAVAVTFNTAEGWETELNRAIRNRRFADQKTSLI